MGQQNDAINVSNRNIQLGIENLTAMMTGAKGGYKLSEYDEDGHWLRDLYMDTPDKATAKRILQINKDGIAASTSGYEGPYTVGITVDGQIQGSWIAANSIDTNHLSIGLNTTIQGLEDGMQSVVRKDGIISAINQTSEEVSINASRINLNGSVTANTNMDWAPTIPSSWSVSRIRNHFEILKRIAGEEGFDVFSVTQQGLKVRDVTVYEGQLAANYSGYQFVYPGEFAMNHMDLLTGGVGIADHLGVTSPDYRVFRLFDEEKCYAPYYLHVFQLCYRRHAF